VFLFSTLFQHITTFLATLHINTLFYTSSYRFILLYVFTLSHNSTLPHTSIHIIYTLSSVNTSYKFNSLLVLHTRYFSSIFIILMININVCNTSIHKHSLHIHVYTVYSIHYTLHVIIQTTHKSTFSIS
jgi:hypothetical protein